MKCERCQSEHDGSYGSGRFCCCRCARGFATALSRGEINKKVSEKMSGRGAGIENRQCLLCGKDFSSPVVKNKKFCTRKCSAIYTNSRPEIISHLRSVMLKKVKDGTHSGWKSRKGKPPSYAEKFFMDVLKNNNIQYERDLPVGRWFIDFAIKDKMIALEIDGKQHEYDDRKKSDEIKDKYLTNSGWRVYRIKWKSINDKVGNTYIKTEIDKFLELYRSVA